MKKLHMALVERADGYPGSCCKSSGVLTAGKRANNAGEATTERSTSARQHGHSRQVNLDAHESHYQGLSPRKSADRSLSITPIKKAADNAAEIRLTVSRLILTKRVRARTLRTPTGSSSPSAPHLPVPASCQSPDRRADAALAVIRQTRRGSAQYQAHAEHRLNDCNRRLTVAWVVASCRAAAERDPASTIQTNVTLSSTLSIRSSSPNHIFFAYTYKRISVLPPARYRCKAC